MSDNPWVSKRGLLHQRSSEFEVTMALRRRWEGREGGTKHPPLLSMPKQLLLQRSGDCAREMGVEGAVPVTDPSPIISFFCHFFEILSCIF
jgi:hypothetical protein